MKDKPIIFSAPMVLAILREIETLGAGKTMTRRYAWSARKDTPDIVFPSPWQNVSIGDRLWIRETWKPHSLYAHMKPRDVPHSTVFYAADKNRYAPSNTPLVTCIHMPRWVSRITLHVAAVKIERLQDISGADCRSEGIVGKKSEHPFDGALQREFSDLWKSLHGEQSWADNPEVVAISFTPELANIDRAGKLAA